MKRTGLVVADLQTEWVRDVIIPLESGYRYQYRTKRVRVKADFKCGRPLEGERVKPGGDSFWPDQDWETLLIAGSVYFLIN